MTSRSTLKSHALFERARTLMPGGVNSPVRAFKAVGGAPRFIASAAGARVTDVDGNSYVDYVCSWGPMILGHGHPAVVNAIRDQAAVGVAYGAPSDLEVRLAELIQRSVPSIEMLRMVNSGTEATMAAIRLARAATGRPKIIKFEGCYHGHADSFLIRAGSGAATFGTPDSPGVTPATARDTLTAGFNDADSVTRLLTEHKGDVAAVIVEPVVGNMGVVPPEPGFLEALRQLTEAQGALLIFDEVMTGFRVARGGAQQRFGVRPDLTTLGKVIGGGLPVGAYGGRADLMRLIAPEGAVYQAGTLSGNPLSMRAGVATLETIEALSDFYDRLEDAGATLERGIAAELARRALPCTIARVASMWTLFMTPSQIRDWSSARRSDVAAYARFFQAMLERGFMLAPSQFEANFISAAHTSADIDATITAVRESLGVAFV